jgi:hypothetical protein
MNEDLTVTTDDEPASTLKNSRTIRAEEDLARETSTRTADGAIPTGYGSDGGYIGPEAAKEDDSTPDDEMI